MLDLTTFPPSRKPAPIVGRKDDTGKLRWDLVPWAQLEDVVKVLTNGASKYGDTNWRSVPDGTNRYFAATMRHLSAWRQGEVIDKESGLPHLAHAACSLLFIAALDGPGTPHFYSDGDVQDD